jgi:hypothetical protein
LRIGINIGWTSLQNDEKENMGNNRMARASISMKTVKFQKTLEIKDEPVKPTSITAPLTAPALELSPERVIQLVVHYKPPINQCTIDDVECIKLF